MISDSDLDPCFSTNDFAVTAQFADAVDPDYTIEVNGYFSDGTDAVKLYDSMIEALEPAFICKTSDIEEVTRGWEAFINSEYYRVERIERAGTGVSTIYLTKAS